MRHLCQGLTLLALLIFLTPIPSWSGPNSPAGTTPAYPFVNLPDIVVAPITYHGPTLADIGMKSITYQGPTLADIGMKSITYQGPELTDLVLPSIHFSSQTLELAKAKTQARNLSQAATPTPVSQMAHLIPGATPRIKILSPQSGQGILGPVVVEVQLSGWQGIPPVDLSWWWNPPTPAGQWPAAPQRMTVVKSLNGTTRIVIPRSAFPKSGQWRLKAAVKVAANRQMIDDVSFTLAEIASQPGDSGLKKTAPKQLSPSTTVHKPTLHIK
ncbi:MAG: hypothetical protein JXB25_10050 [Deltaproteobacteria bacterium]|nr:hypothetical protein [Deltaproteobacteria bacterium]